MIVEAVYKLLSSDAGIMQVIGEQLHYEHRPQGQTGAAIVLQRGSLTTEQNHGGVSGFHTGFVRVNILAPQYLQCGDIAQRVRGILNGYSGDVTLGDPEQTDYHVLPVAFIALEEESDIPNVLAEGQSQPRMYGIAADYRFGHHPAIHYINQPPLEPIE